MTAIAIKEHLTGRRAIKRAARDQGLPVQTIRTEIQQTIWEAWAAADRDPAVKRRQASLFPEGMPTPEIFVARLGAYARRRNLP